jgi:hypothetical protein
MVARANSDVADNVDYSEYLAADEPLEEEELGEDRIQESLALSLLGPQRHQRHGRRLLGPMYGNFRTDFTKSCHSTTSQPLPPTHLFHQRPNVTSHLLRNYVPLFLSFLASITIH